MAWVVTQGTGATATQISLGNAGALSTTLAITPGAVGSFLFFTASIGENATLHTWSASDNVDGAWTVVQVQSGVGGASQTTCVIGFRDNCSSTAARTVSLTRNSSTGSSSISWALGAATHTGVVFATDGQASAGGGLSTPAATITVSGLVPGTVNDLILAVGSNDGGSAWTHPVAGDSGWTLLQALWNVVVSGAGTDGKAVAMVYGSVASLSTIFTETGASSHPTGLVLAFKGPTGTPSAVEDGWHFWEDGGENDVMMEIIAQSDSAPVGPDVVTSPYQDQDLIVFSFGDDAFDPMMELLDFYPVGSTAPPDQPLADVDWNWDDEVGQDILPADEYALVDNITPSADVDWPWDEDVGEELIFDDPQLPDAVQLGPQRLDWNWDEDAGEDAPLDEHPLVDAVQLTSPPDDWPWDEDASDDWVDTLVQDRLNNPPYPKPRVEFWDDDVFDEWDITLDQQQLVDATTATQPVEHDWNWDEDAGEEAPLDDYPLVDAVQLGPQEDWPWDEDVSDEWWEYLDTSHIGNPPYPKPRVEFWEDDYTDDWDVTLDQSQLVDFVAAPQPVEHDWNWDEDAGEDAPLDDYPLVDAVQLGPQRLDWSWEEDVGEDAPLDDYPLVDNIPAAQPQDLDWNWDEDVGDDWDSGSTDAVGPDVVSTPALTYSDEWDWSADNVDDDLWWAVPQDQSVNAPTPVNTGAHSGYLRQVLIEVYEREWEEERRKREKEREAQIARQEKPTPRVVRVKRVTIRNLQPEEPATMPAVVEPRRAAAVRFEESVLSITAQELIGEAMTSLFQVEEMKRRLQASIRRKRRAEEEAVIEFLIRNGYIH